MFRKKVRRDAELIKNEARVVVFVDENFNVSVNRNEQGKVNVIGIIGPGTSHNGYYLREALLEEVGIGSSRPYHKGKIPECFREPEKSHAITYRYRGFILGRDQYLVVAPPVFEAIQNLTDECVANWRSGGPDDPYRVSGTKYHYNRSEEKLHRYLGMVAVTSGARFSVALNSFFLRDIFWAGQELNVSLEKFARLINMRLVHRLKRWRGKREFAGLLRAKEIHEIIEKSRLPKYLLPAAISHLPGGEANQFAPFLRQIIGWQETVTPEQEMALNSFPKQRARLGDIQLLVTTGLEARKDYITFEVFPGENYFKVKQAKLIREAASPASMAVPF
jgi:hypothetical protein